MTMTEKKHCDLCRLNNETVKLQLIFLSEIEITQNELSKTDETRMAHQMRSKYESLMK